MSLIGISGKKQHGKDTVAKIIQYLMFDKRYSGHSHTFESFCNSKMGEGWRDYESGWKTKQFAGKLKQVVALLIGCTLEQLEDNKFKETPLGEEWMRWCTHIVTGTLVGIYNTQEEAKEEAKKWSGSSVTNEYLTPRKLLQVMGTEAGRNLIHPNIWVNALMADYIPVQYHDGGEYYNKGEYPNWIITDVRFENEAKAIKDRQGFLFRVERFSVVSTDNHPSETSLDNYMQFTDYIRNDGTVENLVEEVRSVLTSFNIIK